MNRHRRGISGASCAALLTVALAATACSDPAPSRTTASTTRPAARECAWPYRADRVTMNIAYPDTNATYWSMPLAVAVGTTVEIDGRRPDARYFSFVTYDRSGRPLEVHHAANGAITSAYRLRVVTADSGVARTLVYRVYLPRTARDVSGGVGLPSVVFVAPDGTKRHLEPCSEPGNNPAAAATVDRNGPSTSTPAPPQPVFVRPALDGSGLYPNPDNTYLATILAYRPGRVAVLRGTAPSTPETARGSEPPQVRYWSVCTDEYRKPYPVSACLADRDVVLDATGTFTIVISTPQDRPSSATRAAGVTWLAWGSTNVDNLVLVRQMLAAPTFAEAAARVAPGHLASSTMGRYAPVGAYCTKHAFDTLGAVACTTAP